MQEIDKTAMGERVRQIRLRAKLRQWELAKLLGTTQSAVHKYEHGVVPEPRRLVELSRIGNTSIEWVLTGHHWEDGSEEQQRLSPELLGTACLLREILDENRAPVDEALRVVREAVRALETLPSEGASQSPSETASSLRHYSRETLRLLENASRIQKAIMQQVLRESEDRLRASEVQSRDEDDGTKRHKG